MATVIAQEAPRQDDVIVLLQGSDEYMLGMYPPESCHLLSVDELERPGVTLLVARRDGVAVGIGALVERGDGSAELKRMFVTAEARGLGIASGILRSLESLGIERSIATIQLETGPLQLEAIALYAKHGYSTIPNFGPYVGDEFSVCMEKSLSPQTH